MEYEEEFILGNSFRGKIYGKLEGLEEIVQIINSREFLEEVKVMDLFRGVPPFHLLVYDKFLALGIYGEDKKISLGVKSYSESNLLSWIDTFISFDHNELRIVNKMDAPEEFKKRLDLRTKLPWINYNLKTNLISEIQKEDCLFKKHLREMPLTNELYSLYEIYGKTFAVHLKINDEINFVGDAGLIPGIKSEGRGTQEYKLPIEEVEEKLKTEHPEALVFRAPLLTCTFYYGPKYGSCLGNIFEEVYAEKLGFDPTRIRKESPKIFSN